MDGRQHTIEIFAELGDRLRGFGVDGHSARVVAEAYAANGWFLPTDIVDAVEAIRADMLREEALTRWTAPYPYPVAPKRIAVIMAGNIPLVGFFDLLCVLAAGHHCYIKPSSKDTVLIRYIVSLLRDIDPGIPVFDYAGQPVAAVIATGSDNTNRYFRSIYGNLPSVMRGSRSSAAILTGDESESDLRGLAHDIFSYSGLGCRNVSHLFLPKGYRAEQLIEAFSSWPRVNPKYVNNFRQRRAVLALDKRPYLPGEFFLLREDDGFPTAISEITYQHYSGIKEVSGWLAANDGQIQCAVHDASATGITYSRSAGFGDSQRPGLTDYPDERDILEFLSHL